MTVFVTFVPVATATSYVHVSVPAAASSYGNVIAPQSSATLVEPSTSLIDSIVAANGAGLETVTLPATAKFESTVLATGGLSSLIARFSTTIQHLDPWLTLHGLRIVYERNAGTIAAGAER